jgi:hypothetical protein
METNLWQKYKDDGLKVIAIDASSGDIPYPTMVADYTDYLGVTYPAGVESLTFTYNEFSAHYEGSNPFPIDIIVDQDGIIQFVSREYDSGLIEDKIVELLGL